MKLPKKKLAIKNTWSNSPMTKNILFDFDGTLSDSGKSITNSVLHALEKSGIDISDLSQKELEKFIGPPLHQSFQDFYGFSQQQSAQAVAHFREYFNEKGIFENEMYVGIPDMLKTVKDSGYNLYIATSKPQVYAKQILNDFGIDHFFTDIVGSDLSEKSSNKTEIIKAVLANNSLTPETCIMVGDREHDIFGAHQCNMKAIGVLYGFGDLPELEAVKADHIVATIPKLTELLITL